LKPVPCPERLEPAPPISPGERLSDILAALTSRMSEAQRHAFLAKMAELDRQRFELSPFSATLGSA
jgi:hypothetical protein